MFMNSFEKFLTLCLNVYWNLLCALHGAFHGLSVHEAALVWELDYFYLKIHYIFIFMFYCIEFIGAVRV